MKQAGPINEKGETVIRPFVVDNGPDYFEDGLARFRIDNKFGFFDRTGKIIIGAQFDFAFPFHEGLAAICAGCKEEPEGESIENVEIEKKDIFYKFIIFRFTIIKI